MKKLRTIRKTSRIFPWRCVYKWKYVLPVFGTLDKNDDRKVLMLTQTFLCVYKSNEVTFIEPYPTFRVATSHKIV